MPRAAAVRAAMMPRVQARVRAGAMIQALMLMRKMLMMMMLIIDVWCALPKMTTSIDFLPPMSISIITRNTRAARMAYEVRAGRMSAYR